MHHNSGQRLYVEGSPVIKNRKIKSPRKLHRWLPRFHIRNVRAHVLEFPSPKDKRNGRFHTAMPVAVFLGGLQTPPRPEAVCVTF
jgi:hypothetical protein